MSQRSYTKDQRHPGNPQVARGGGTQPEPQESTAATAGTGSEAQRREGGPGPGGGAAYDLKSGNLPEPKSDSGV